eukprot:6567507-Pyramimonas_sp.AAC.1
MHLWGIRSSRRTPRRGYGHDVARPAKDCKRTPVPAIIDSGDCSSTSVSGGRLRTQGPPEVDPRRETDPNAPWQGSGDRF